MEENIVVNVEFEGTKLGTVSEVQVVPVNIAWEDLELMLKVYADNESLVVSYQDEDNDRVLIGSQDELSEAFKVARKCNNTLCLHVVCNPSMASGAGEGTPRDGLQEGNLHVSANVQDQSVSLSTAAVPEMIPTNSTEDSDKMETEEAGDGKGEVKEVQCGTTSAAETEVEVKKTPVSTPVDIPSPPAAMIDGKPENTLRYLRKLFEKSVEAKPRYFFLRNRSSGWVLDINGGNPSPGTAVIVWQRKADCEGISNQLWYEDKESGTIRSKLNDLCLDVTGMGGKVTPYLMGKTSQQWFLKGGCVLHRFNPNWGVVLPRKVVPKGTVVVAADVNTAENTQWIADYKDKKFTNRETGEQCPTAKVCRPKAKVPGRAQREHYAVIAEHIGETMRSQEQEAEKCQAATQAAASTQEDEAPPSWFFTYMEKFKKEIADDISRMVSRRTVRHILKGLDGAVIASVRGTSGLCGAMDTTAPVRETGSSSGSSSPSAPPLPPRSGRKVIYCHDGVICDHCERVIVGVRYKCGNCDDFDLCEECEPLEGIHDPSHVFLKIIRPVPLAGRKKSGQMCALLKRSLYDAEDSASPSKKPFKEEEKALKREYKMRHSLEKMERKMKKKEEKLKRCLEHANDSPQKKEKLDLPQAKKMDSCFIQDETIPDGTHVQPGTKLIKKWVMRNTGLQAWCNTELRMMWGNMTSQNTEVKVAALEPGEEGVIAVELVAPAEPGVYQSHWRLSHEGMRFGHRVWCSIIVDPKETLEPRNTLEQKEENPDANICTKQDKDIEKEDDVLTPEPEGSAKVIDLTAKDLLSFEMLELRDRNTPKMSQTATPNNTPQVMTPPKSPIPEVEHVLSNSSSVEIVGGMDQYEEQDEETAASMTELVQERMASLGLRPAHDVDDDLEGWSSCSETFSDDTDDFYVVPIPDCFNPELPASKSATTSVIVKKNQEGSDRSVDDMLTASTSLETHPLLPATAQSNPQTGKVTNSDVDDDVVIVRVELPTGEETSVPLNRQPPAPIQPQVIDDDEHVETDQNANLPLDINENSAGTPNQETDDDDTAAEQGEEEGAVGGVPIPIVGNHSELNREGSPSAGEIASTLMTATLGVAKHAAKSAYSTAKDVFHTLQARNQYMPPESNWTPPANNWTPPQTQWTPPQSTWTPQENTFSPPEPKVPEPKLETPMDQLMEMGFANRERNKELLEKHDNDIGKVIQELIQIEDNDWHAKRF